MMPPVVFDTNAIVSATLLPRSTTRHAFQKARQLFQLVTSASCYDELTDVLMRPKFRKYISLLDTKQFLDEFAQKSRLIAIGHTVTDCRDPRDNKFLELALSADASYLVTGDADLLVMNPYQGITILIPTAFSGI